MTIYGYLWWIFPLKMVIFHSYVSLPEGNQQKWTLYDLNFNLADPP
jgi:hypothetical protein